MAKKPSNIKSNKKINLPKATGASSHRDKDRFYQRAKFKNSNIVLGRDVLEKLRELSQEMFDYDLNIEKIQKEEIGFILSSLTNLSYNKKKSTNHVKIEAAKNIKAMKFYHCYQAASQMNEHLINCNHPEKVRFEKIRKQMEKCPKTKDIWGLDHSCSRGQNWSDTALKFILDINNVNKEIKRLNKD